jgi:hypothetical protein
VVSHDLLRLLLSRYSKASPANINFFVWNKGQSYPQRRGVLRPVQYVPLGKNGSLSRRGAARPLWLKPVVSPDELLAIRSRSQDRILHLERDSIVGVWVDTAAGTRRKNVKAWTSQVRDLARRAAGGE